MCDIRWIPVWTEAFFRGWVRFVLASSSEWSCAYMSRMVVAMSVPSSAPDLTGTPGQIKLRDRASCRLVPSTHVFRFSSFRGRRPTDMQIRSTEVPVCTCSSELHRTERGRGCSLLELFR